MGGGTEGDRDGKKQFSRIRSVKKKKEKKKNKVCCNKAASVFLAAQP